MAQLEQTVDSRLKDIVEKLQKLDCILLGNKDDAWILELLFSPGFHRCHLIEWILSKLDCDIRKISGPQNSEEERLKNLQSTISGLGICRENINDVIKGTATTKEQLDFWCTLVDIIWTKHEITISTSVGLSDEGIAVSPEKKKSIKCIEEEYECTTSAINSICNAVNLKHLFEHEVCLLAPDVERETRNISSPKSEMHVIPSLQDIKASVQQPTANSPEQYRSLLSLGSVADENEEDDAFGSELSQLEEELHNMSVDFQNSAQHIFTSTFNELKTLILQIKKDTSPDVGEHFKALESNLEDFSELTKSFPKLDSSNSKISDVVSSLDDLLNQETLADPKYLNVLKLLKDENC